MNRKKIEKMLEKAIQISRVIFNLTLLLLAKSIQIAKVIFSLTVLFLIFIYNKALPLGIKLYSFLKDLVIKFLNSRFYKKKKKALLLFIKRKRKKLFILYKKERRVFLKFYQQRKKKLGRSYFKFVNRNEVLKRADNCLSIAFNTLLKLSLVAEKKVVVFYQFLWKNFSNLFSQRLWFRVSTFSVLGIIFISIIFSNKNISAATYTFVQNNWSGGASSDIASHPDGQSMWNKFFSKDDNLEIIDGGQLKLSLLNVFSGKMNSGGFSQDGLNQIEINGSGGSASLNIKKANFTEPFIHANQARGVVHLLKSDGSLWSWGSGDYDAFGLGAAYNYIEDYPIPSGITSNGEYLNNIIDISSGSSRNLALSADGYVWKWGNSGGGNIPIRVLAVDGSDLLSDVIAITANYSASYALRSDGTVYSFDSTNNGLGALGDGTFVNKAGTHQVVGPLGEGFLTDIIDIDSFANTVYALKSDGTVWSWGSDSVGVLGRGTVNEHSSYPVQVLGTDGTNFLEDIILISAGSSHALALDSSGRVYAWGFNGNRELGVTGTNRYYPVRVLGENGVGFLENIRYIDAGYRASMAISNDGLVFAWGSNQYGKSGVGSSSSPISFPTKVSNEDGSGFLQDVDMISLGVDSSYAIKNNGEVLSWGRNENSQLGTGSTVDRNRPGLVLSNEFEPFNVSSNSEMITKGNASSVFVFDKTADKVYSWGKNTWDVLGYAVISRYIRARRTMYEGLDSYIPNLSQVVFCGSYVLALDSSQNVWAFGNNFYGQLGNGNNSNSTVPVQVLGVNGAGHLSGVANLSCATGNSSYALLTDGSVLSWGRNDKGQLGNDAIDHKNFPVYVLDTDGVTPLSGITQLSGGHDSAYALRSDGSVLAWGRNNVGQLGDGSSIDQTIPVQMNGLSNITSISAAGNWQGGVFFAIDSNKNVWALGRNQYGVLGVGDTSNKSAPTQVLGVNGSGFLSGILSIKSDSYATIALNDNGEVFSWGLGTSGQLGIGEKISSSIYPIRVKNSDNSGYLENINSIGISQVAAHVIDTAGNVWSWGGAGFNGVLGNNTGIDKLLPAPSVISSGSIENFNAGYNSYHLSGIYTSPVIDLGQKSASFSTLELDQIIPEGTTITIDIRAGDDSDTSDNSWTDWTNGLLHEANISFLGSKRYVQYRANLSTSDDSVSPILNDVIINYSYYPSNQTLISSKYDAIDNTNIIGFIGIDEGIFSSGAEVVLSIRTAPTAESLDSALWHDFTNSSSGCSKEDGKFTCPSLPSALTSGEDDRFWQYKVTLNSDGSETAVISEVEVRYVVNAPPEVQNVVALQNEDGLIDISYEVRDVDSLAGSYTPGKILPSFEYYDGDSWILCETLSSGAEDLKNVEMDNFTTYSLTWNAKTDFNGNYIEDMKIRVRVDDGEAANNINQAESGYFSLDTKDPNVIIFSIDGRSDSVNNLSIAVTDDTPTNLKMKISNRSDLTADGLNANSGLWLDYASTTAWTFSGDASSVYYQIKDAYSNISNNGVVSEAVLPAKPPNILYQDVSNVETEEWREFIAWGQSSALPLGFKQYNIYRSTDGNNFSLIATQSDRLSNFILDSNLDTNEIYYYKVTAEDNDGNISSYSDVVFDRPDGQGGTDLTPPVISNIVISEVTAQSALVTWETDEPSNSVVSYITNDSGDFTDAPGVIVNSMTDNAGRLGKHSVFLNNLSPATVYYIQVSSADPNGNVAVGGSGLSITTLGGPVISNVQVSNVQNSTATITWDSSEFANSRVFYSTSTSMLNPSEMAINESRTSHSVNLTELNNGVRYFFYVQSGLTQDRNIIDGELMYYNFLTTSDITAPQITFDPDTDIFDKQEDSIRISWITDEPAISTIEYSVDDSYDSLVTNTNYNTNHYFSLSDLEKGTTYNFRLKSADANNNLRTISDLSFTTADYSDVVAPIISQVLAKQVADVSALISWETDEPANSTVEYGSVSGDYDKIATSSALNYSHSVLLEDLDIKTTYYFRALSSDANNNSTSSEEYSFTTKDALVAGATSTTIIVKEGGGVLVIDKTDKSKPIISNLQVGNITSDRAIVSWTTNEPANSVVEFGLSEEYGQASVSLEMNSSHSQTLNNLSPNSVYYFKVSSSDLSGNISDSKVGTFTTLSLENIEDLDDLLDFDDLDSEFEDLNFVAEEGEDDFDDIISPEKQIQNDNNFLNIFRRTLTFIRQASKSVSPSILESSLIEHQEAIKELANMTELPNITSGPIINVWEDMAVITWETDKKTGSLVAITEGNIPFSSYDLVQNFGKPEVYSNNHQVIISGLKPATSYNYQLRGNTRIGSSVLSVPGTFTTLSKPAKIDNYVIDRINNESASFKWTSSLPTNSLVQITPYRNGVLSIDEAVAVSSDRITTIHEITVDDLEPGVIYRVDLSGRDSARQILSQTIESFSTTDEVMPFIIEQVKTNSALAGAEGLRVQSIISWNTSKLATSKVYFRKGISQDDVSWPFETILNSAYNRKHLVVITDFLPGEVYQFQVESEASNGQKIRSNTYTILTPRQRESVFQVILNNIEQTFGWIGTFGK